jgi:uncharacterized protein YggE
MHPKLLTTALALILLTTTSLARAQFDKEDKVPDLENTPRITVSGEGRVSSAPDLADINVGVITQAQTARDALNVNTTSMTKLYSLLKEHGIAEKDIQTSNLNVSPQYTQPPQAAPGQRQRDFVPQIAAYQVTNTVTITVREMGKVGSILDALVTAGANQMYGISFRIAEPAKLLDEARKKAVADARRKAELLAGEAGVVLGRPLRISESGGFVPSPMPMMRGRMMAMSAEVAPAPVAGGELDLTASVQIEYELKAPK